MVKKEILEIRKLFTREGGPLERICGCYVDSEKQKRSVFTESYASLPETDAVKYAQLFQKTLSGNIGKTLHNLDFPLEEEHNGGAQNCLENMRRDALVSKEMTTVFYDRVIDSFDYVGNYLILLGYGVYDVPGKASDGDVMEDASDEVYQFLTCCICPVDLEKSPLTYQRPDVCFLSDRPGWAVGKPIVGFLYPAFHERGADIHSTLYYTKKTDDDMELFVHGIFGISPDMPAKTQKESFAALIAASLGPGCKYETAVGIHEAVTEKIEEGKSSGCISKLDRVGISRILEDSGADQDAVSGFDSRYLAYMGDQGQGFIADNVTEAGKVVIAIGNTKIRTDIDHAYAIKVRIVDGRKCVVIPIEDGMDVNGIPCEQC